MSARTATDRTYAKPEKLSWWLAEALADGPPETVQLDRSLEADVCIVGGGFTGLWSAIEIKEREPSARVVIVERGICGSGASGRNGGFVLSLWAKFLSLQKLCGTSEALRLAAASADAVRHIGRFCRTHAIDADFRKSGWLWSATSRAQLGAWAETVSAIETEGQKPFEQLFPGAVAALTGSQRHLGGVLEPGAACVQPARLAWGLRRVALELGVEIFENTPMIDLKRESPPRVRCPRGQVTAGSVVIALNAWGVSLRAIRKAVAAVSSDIVVTAPAKKALDRIGWSHGVAVSDSRTLVHYYRTTADGRVVFGKGGGSGTLAFGGNVGPAFDGPSPIAATVERQLRETFPDLGAPTVEQSWTGPIARSGDGLPLFGRLNDCPRVLYGVGYSGNGVGPSVLGGRILASLALGVRDEWSECGLVRPLTRAFPPEPFRFAGGKLVRAAIARRDKANDAGREPGPLVRAVASLAPVGLSPVRERFAEPQGAERRTRLREP